MQDTDVQQDFDQLVRTAERWLLAPAHSPDELQLEQAIEEARRRDPGVAEAALDVAWSRVAPPELGWRAV